MPRRNFVIVGLGLIGGSLAQAIRKRFPGARVVGVSRNPRKIAFAVQKRLIHKGFTQIRPALQNAGFVFICSPVDSIPKLILEVDRHALPKTIVTDVGSTKGNIVRWADLKRFHNIQFVGSHPLAGSHLTGVGHARADLFNGAFVFVTPGRKSNRQAVRIVSRFWKRLRASVCMISPEAHDKIVSEISHLPHAVASLLMHTVPLKSLRYGASGFRDTTRIAQGDPSLWVPIFLTNRANLCRDLRRFEKSTRHLIALLEKRSAPALRRFLQTASVMRSRVR